MKIIITTILILLNTNVLADFTMLYNTESTEIFQETFKVNKIVSSHLREIEVHKSTNNLDEIKRNILFNCRSREFNIKYGNGSVNIPFNDFLSDKPSKLQSADLYNYMCESFKTVN